jgi:hypothetical protein
VLPLTVHGLTGVKVTLVDAGEENVKVKVLLAPCAEVIRATRKTATEKPIQRIFILLSVCTQRN